MAYNWETINSEPGQWKGVNVARLDPILAVADTSVNYEMCDVGNNLATIKNIASLDYSSMADSGMRTVLVTALESPETMEEINKIYDAAACQAKKFEKQAESWETNSSEPKPGNEGWTEWDESTPDD